MSMNRTMYIDIKSADLQSLCIGDKVTVQVTGVIKGLNAGSPPEGDYEGSPPDMRLEVSGMKVISSNNDWADMAAEDD